MRRLELLSLCLVVAGCGQEPALGSATSAVKGGSEAPDDDAVVAVVNFAGGNCTGALIAPDLVLTARHCVAETGDQKLQVVCGQTKFDPPDSPGAIFVVPKPSITEDPEDYAAVAAVRMPAGQGDDLCGTDVVLLALKEPVVSVTPLSPRVERATQSGETYSAVGYGLDEAVAGSPSGVRKRLDGLTVSCAGAECAEADVRDNEWVGSGGPCSGDSGGPALDAEGRVLGVVSRGKSGCSEPVFGDVSSRADWLRAEAIAAANAARRSPPEWAPCSEQTPCVALDDEDASCGVARGPEPARSAWASAALALVLLGRRLSRKT